MNSLPSNGFNRETNPDFDTMNTTYVEMLDQFEADIDLLRRAARRRRKALRRQTRREAVATLAVYGKPAMVMLGTTLFMTGIAMLMAGQPATAMDMFNLALTAWSGAFSVPSQP
ncbi:MULTISPECIES: hypothetical protein [unclassified Streptomyces]|uniref:hypothetical protein n=1 Tax=unclassified Streptomyces TaxID=2593676 RepID=UPI002E1120DA|nr:MULTISPECIES: hypothetical protein [unclassified Streptomyces]WSR23996.1 hypothetical protein OG573_36345 [Streptomyces sp. NBC_01205]